MDYKLKKLYEQMLSGSYSTESSKQSDQISYNSLSMVYEKNVLRSQGPNKQLLEAKGSKQFYYYQADASVIKNILDYPNEIPVKPAENIEQAFSDFNLPLDKAKPLKGTPAETERRILRVKKAAESAGSGNFYFQSNIPNATTLPATSLIKNIGLAADKQINQGHAGEAILGAALTCRFIASENTPVEYFDKEEAKGIVPILIQILEQNKITGHRMKTGPQHLVEFVLNLNQVTTASLLQFCKYLEAQGTIESIQKDNEWAKENFFSPKNLNSTLYLMEAAKNYANGDHATEKLKEASSEKIPGTIAIESIGGGPTQSSTKVDLRIRYKGQTSSKNLLNLSLKTGKVSQFGQVSGGSLTRYKEFFDSIFENILDKINAPADERFKFLITPEDQDLSKTKPEWFKQSSNTNVSDLEKKQMNFKQGPLKYLYEQVTQYIKSINSQELAQILYSGIKYHATLNEQDVDVEMLILNPKENSFLKNIPDKEKKAEKYKNYYEKLSFNTSLSSQLSKCKFNVMLNAGTQTTFEIVIKASTDNLKEEEILSLRSNLSSFRNRVEMGPLLKQFANKQKEAVQQAQQAIEKAEQQPAPQQVAPKETFSQN